MSKGYNPNQPRVPAGSSNGGQWVKVTETIDTNFAARKASEKRGFRIPLNAFGKAESSNTPQKSKEIPVKPEKAYGFDKDRLTTDHHTKHIKEMGFKDQKEYVRAAIDFWERGQGETYYSERLSCFYKYNRKTKHFLSIKADGTIRTFYICSERKFENKFLGDKLHNV